MMTMMMTKIIENALFGLHPAVEEAQQKQTLNALNDDDD